MLQYRGDLLIPAMSLPPSDLIGDSLSYDPLAEAERITGSSYKDDESTAFLGMMLAMEHSRSKSEIMRATNDTCHNNTLEETVSIIEGMGFQLMLSDSFTSVCGEKTSEEKWFIYWKEGILVFFDTFRGSLNSGHAYFNLSQAPSPENRYSLHGFSGSYARTKEGDVVSVGSIDIREGFRYKLNSFGEKGTFLSEWVEQPFLWLLHHMDTKEPNYDYDSINRERISLLPVDVQKAILGWGI